MSFQLTRTHTSVVLAATTIAASLVVIPSLAEGNQASQDGFCAALTGAEPRITSEYNPLLASYAAGAAGASTPSATGSDRETELRDALDAAKASLAAAQQSAVNATASTVADNTTDVDTVSRALGWVDWSQVDDATQAKIIEVLVVQKMNAYRVNAGLPELVVSDTLTSDSRSWSQHMSDTDDFSHDPTWKYWNGVTLDGGETSYAGENIAYNYRENFGDKWGAYGTTKDPMQAANALFDQWKNSPGHDKNMLARNNVVGVGVHIAKHGQFTRIYGTQKFYAISGSGVDTARFHTTGDAASAYGFDGAAFVADNTNYVSGLAGSGDEQRANSWQNLVGALPGVVLPVDVNQLPTKAGADAPAASAAASAGAHDATVDNQAVAAAQANVDAAQAALDDYLANPSSEQSPQSLSDIDAQLDTTADAIAADTSVRPEKDGGVTMQGTDQSGRYLTADEYRNAVTRCMTSAGSYDPAKPADQKKDVPNPSIGQPTQEPSAPAPGPSAPAPSQSTPSTPTPSAPAPAPSTPAPSQSTPSIPTPSAPAPGPSTPAPAPSAPAPASDEGTNPSNVRVQTLAATGSSAVWVAVGAVAVLVAGIGALVASRRAKN